MSQARSPSKLTVSFLVLIAACFKVTVSNAEQASPIPVFVEQGGSGLNITILPQGGDYIQYLSDENGYTVVRTFDQNGTAFYYYAERLENGLLGASDHLVGTSDPEALGIRKGILPEGPAYFQYCVDNNLHCGNHDPLNETQNGRRLQQQDWPKPRPKMKNLVVLMRFSDHVNRTLPTVADFEIMTNNVGPDQKAPTGSVRDVFLKSSYGQLNITSTVHEWVTLPNTEKYYADGNYGFTEVFHEALRNSLDQLEADPNFDFGEFDEDDDGWIDAIAFVFSGYSASNGETDQYGADYLDRIWPHKSSLWSPPYAWESNSTGVKVFRYHASSALWSYQGDELNHIGSMAHETGHFLGLPDLYDTTDEGDFKYSDAGSGIGNYDIMANNWGFDSTQFYPPHMSAWTRLQLGWDTPTVIEEEGTYSIAAAELQEGEDTSASGIPKMYKISAGYPDGEYLLIENRQPLHFDADMPQGGLVIYHIDEFTTYYRQGWPEQIEEEVEGGIDWPLNGKHYRIAVLPADGSYNLETAANRGGSTELYHGGGVNEVGPSNSITDGPFPNTDAYQDGNVTKTGHRIFDISSSGNVMTFKYENTEAEAPDPGTSAPGTSPPDPGTSAAFSCDFFVTKAATVVTVWALLVGCFFDV